MATINKIQGVESLLDKLKRRRGTLTAQGNPVVVVGFTQAYAVYVHEDMQANHPPLDVQVAQQAKLAGMKEGPTKARLQQRIAGYKGQAKFLEQPAREMRRELGEQIKQDVQNGMPLGKALLRAGMRLQRAAEELVPVDTSALKASGFTDFEENLEAASAAAKARGDAKRQAANAATGSKS